MDCPKCGQKEISDDVCPRCGIIISKYLERQAQRQSNINASREWTKERAKSDDLPNYKEKEKRGYIEQNLLKDERVVYQANLHWYVYTLPALFAFFFLMFGRYLFLFFLIFLVVTILAWFRTKTSEFAVTNKRIIIKVGVISTKTLELLLQKVETVAIEQSILGRILNYGTLTVIGTGGTKSPFKFIKDPLEFRRQVHALIEERT